MKREFYSIGDQEWEKWIPWGINVIVGKQFGLSRERIRQIRANGTYNREIYEVLKKIALENKEKVQYQQHFVKNIIEQLKQLQS